MSCSSSRRGCRAHIRQNSDWLARYGGEEFLLVLPETGAEGGILVAEKVRTILEMAAFETRAGGIEVTASFGVAATGAQGPALELDCEALIRMADQCLYKSKNAGRNCTTGVEIAAAPAPHAAHG